jgi:cell division cycle 20-like protein 1 (cofactor of APC complex)
MMDFSQIFRGKKIAFCWMDLFDVSPAPPRRGAAAAAGSSRVTTRKSMGGASAAAGDRFIPSRSTTNFDVSFQASQSPVKAGLFSRLLRNELLGEDGVLPEPSGAQIDTASTAAAAGDHASPPPPPPMPGGTTLPNFLAVGTPGGATTRRLWTTPGGGSAQQSSQPPSTPSAALQPPLPPSTPSVLRFRASLDQGATGTDLGDQSPLSPLRSSTRLLQSPGGTTPRRKIANVPFKVLDAPGLADDFYLNVVDWSSNNLVAVGLGSSVYLWSANTSRANKLVDYGAADDVACVAYTELGATLAVGTRVGHLQLYDTEKQVLLRSFEEAHRSRVGCATWNGPILATGSRDKSIMERDIRAPPSSCVVRELQAHRQEVCGLKYSFEGMAGPHRQLASGGNDNRLFVWDARRSASSPLYTFTDHSAAVKAIAWSPHQSGLLASGGGTADRSIRLWSTLTGSALTVMDTGSQVCNLVFSKTLPELVSTHGYSLNQICVWRYHNPTTPLQKLVTLQGHSLRVLYLALSPDGSTILTGAGDESLRFWSVWPGRTSHSDGLRLGGVIIPSAQGALLR